MPVRSRKLVLATTTAGAAVVVAVVGGPGGAQPSTAADFATVASFLAAEKPPTVPVLAKQPSAVAAATSDYFLKLDGIQGESTDAAHKEEIEIHSFSWGLSNSGSGHAGGGAGAGKVTLQDIHFTAGFSKASPKLMLTCATGQHIPKAVLTVRKAGKGQLEFLKIEMKGVLVSSYQTGGSSAVPTDQFSLNFASATVEYRSQNPDGSPSAPVRVELGNSTRS